MSHFSVLVAGDLDSLMAPYCERCEEPGAIKAFDDRTEYVKERMAEVAAKPLAECSKYEKELLAIMLEYDNDVVKVGTSYWFEYELHDGVVGCWHNPEAKWDYYTVGGRFSDRLLRLDGTYCNQALKSELVPDYYHMADDFGQEYDMHRAKAVELGYDPETYITFAQVEASGDNIQAVHWSQQPFIQAFRDYYREFINYPVVGIDDLEQFLTMSREDYIDLKCLRQQFGFAYLDHTGWHAKATMGLFGMIFDGVDNMMTYYREVAALYKALPDDTLITMVDCHI